MRNDLTEIVVVVDRSGSMNSIKDDTQGAINALIKKQKTEPFAANFTLVQFDTEYEFVHKGEDIKNVNEYTLIPRGMTALNDALGRAIQETGERLANLPDRDRPGLVAFFVATDGFENSSKEYTKEQVAKMVKHQKEKYNWQFTFFGADIDGIKEGAGYGVHVNSSVSYSKGQTVRAFNMYSDKLSAVRTILANSGILCAEEFDYSETERKELQHS
ncbi:MAG: VWA domain-containing protein [Candidatus Thorarchaeota archaeon]